MKKRVVSLLLAVCVLCMFTLLAGCTPEESAYSLVHKAVEKTEALDSMACVMNMQMDMATEGMTMSIPVKADIKAAGLKTDSPKAYSAITMTVLGEEVAVEAYQEGDWAYISMDDMGYKTNIAEVENEYDYIDDVDSMLQELPEALLTDVEVVKGENGSASVTVSIPDEQFAEIYDDFIESVNAGTGMEDVAVTISDAVVTITVANGYVSVYDMQFTMAMEVEGIATTTAVKASLTYQNPGEAVTVTPMEGYADYEEFDLSGLLDME